MGGNGSDLGNVGNASTFVTAMVSNNGTTDYTIADANAHPGGVPMPSACHRGRRRAWRTGGTRVRSINGF